jgi:hypothetical protein
MRLAIDMAIVGLIIGLLLGYFIASTPLRRQIDAEQTCVGDLISSARAYASGQSLPRTTSLDKTAYLAAIDTARLGSAEWNFGHLYGCATRPPNSPPGPDVEALFLWDVPFADVKSRFGQPRAEWKLRGPLVRLNTLRATDP